MKTLKLVLAYPPSVNHMYFTHPRTGQRIKTKQAKEWYEDTANKAIKACKEQNWECTPRGTKVVMDILTVFPDRRKRDCHNASKSECDSLEGIVYENDTDVLPRYIDTAIDKENPRVEIVFHLFDKEKDCWRY